MPAFRAAARRGFVLEVDVKLTKDRVPIVIHDATLDRTTPCTGQVSARTYADIHAELPVGHRRHRRQLRAARAERPTPRAAPEAERVPRLRARRGRAHEPRDQEPSRATRTSTTRPPTPTTVIDAIKASGFPPSRLIIQSFWFPNLDLAQAADARRRDELPAARRRERRTVVPRRPRLRLGLGAVAARRPSFVPRAHAARAAGGPVHARHARPDRRGRDERRGRADHERPAARAQDRGRDRPEAGADPAAAERRRPAAPRARSRTLGTIEAYGSNRHGIRVFAMQPKQEARHVVRPTRASAPRSSA